MKPKTRLYVDHPLGQGQPVALTREQAHYLFGVMRLTGGAPVTLFNGRDGEWLAEVTDANKRGGVLTCEAQSAPQGLPPDLWLLFAPIKKARTDFIVEKAVEMGVRRIVPVQTEFTNAERIRRDRLQAHALEAAEQCGATYVPEVADLVRLDRLLADWPAGRRLMFCDETRAGATSGLKAAPSGGLGAPGDPAGAPVGLGDPGGPAGDPGGLSDDANAGAGPTPDPWAIVIGPEGGFSESERARLSALDFAHPVALGPRILRADTAAVAALTLWQMTLGDWR